MEAETAPPHPFAVPQQAQVGIRSREDAAHPLSYHPLETREHSVSPRPLTPASLLESGSDTSTPPPPFPIPAPTAFLEMPTCVDPKVLMLVSVQESSDVEMA